MSTHQRTSRLGDIADAGRVSHPMGLGGDDSHGREAVLDAVPDLIAILGPDFIIRYANRALAERLSLTPEEVVGRCCHQCLDGCGTPPADCPHARSMEDGQEHAGEFELKPLGGWFAVTVTPIRGKGGDVSGSVFVARDISRRKRLEGLLAARVRLGEFAGTHAPIDLLRETLDEAERLTGSQIGFLHFVEPDQHSLSLQIWSTNTLQNMCRAEGAGAHYPIEKAGVWADCVRLGRPVIHNDYAGLPNRKGLPPGHATVVRELVVPVCRLGRIVALLGVGNRPSDYTERELDTVSQLADMAWDLYVRRCAEVDLRESERRLATLMGNLPGMAYRCRNDRDWTMEFVSEGCLALTGHSADRLRNNASVSYGDLIHPDDRDMVWREVQAALVQRKPFQLTYRIVDREGRVRWVWEQGGGVFEDNEVKAIEGFITDITDRKCAEEERLRLERQVQQAQKLESLGVLAGGIAHDFNNILTAVLGHADIGLSGLPEGSPAHDSLLQVSGAARRAADLCHQMLAYAGKASFSTVRVNLRELVEEMSHLLQASISKKASLSLHLDAALPTIRADPSQIRQIVMNLIINASESMGDRGGSITVSAVPVHCGADQLRGTPFGDTLAPGRYIELTVEDTGCGMDEATRERIFEPFFTTKFAGRGLGLAAVLGIVRAHNGALAVRSELGKGTVFRILLPAPEGGEGQPDSGRSQADSRWRGKGTVLFVDDEEMLRELGVQMLTTLGFSVVTAANGRQALDIFAERGGQIDLVLMDLTMPDMDGAEAFTEMRRIDPDGRIILVSGYSSQDLEERFAGAGLVGIIQKPYSLAELRDLLSRVCPAG